MAIFVPFPKIGRLSRDIIVTEKIDGTNASIYIDEFEFLCGSRNRWITPEDDNNGFAKWAHENREELMKLGPGHHFGEWWGKGIQRNYSQTRRYFSLFNVTRWRDPTLRPACCEIVPILFEGPFEEFKVMRGIRAAMFRLQTEGSVAAPGFMNPEGIVVFHTQTGFLFKKTFEKDEAGKGKDNLCP